MFRCNPDYLWGIGEADALPPTTEISVFDSSGILLITTFPQPRGLLANIDQFKNNTTWGQFKWNHEGSPYLASSRELVLQSHFQVPGWMVVLSQPKADALPLNIEIQEKISTESAVVLADATQIHQPVMNLCTNAYHSMLDQGGILEVILELKELSPGARASTLR